MLVTTHVPQASDFLERGGQQLLGHRHSGRSQECRAVRENVPLRGAFVLRQECDVALHQRGLALSLPRRMSPDGRFRRRLDVARRSTRVLEERPQNLQLHGLGYETLRPDQSASSLPSGGG